MLPSHPEAKKNSESDGNRTHLTALRVAGVIIPPVAFLEASASSVVQVACTEITPLIYDGSKLRLLSKLSFIVLRRRRHGNRLSLFHSFRSPILLNLFRSFRWWWTAYHAKFFIFF